MLQKDVQQNHQIYQNIWLSNWTWCSHNPKRQIAFYTGPAGIKKKGSCALWEHGTWLQKSESLALCCFVLIFSVFYLIKWGASRPYKAKITVKELMTQIVAIQSRLESFETWQARLEAIERGVPLPEDDRD